MPNIFFGLNIGRSALLANQTALDVTGHNLANVQTEGFSRQKVALQPSYPTPTPRGALGSGVDAVRVERVQVGYLERQIVSVTAQGGRGSILARGLDELQSTLGEPSSNGLSASLTEFLNSWDALAAQPTDAALRSQVLDRAENLAMVYNQKIEAIASVGDHFDEAIAEDLADVNARLKELAELNGSIAKSEAAGYPANDLRDQRDRVIRQIAEKIGVEAEADGAYVNLRVAGGGPYLVSHAQAYEIAADVDDRGYRANFRVDTAPFTPTGGEIAGLLELRDEVSPGLRTQLSEWMGTIVGRVNGLHAAGADRDGAAGRNLFVWSGDHSQLYLSPSEGLSSASFDGRLEAGTHHLNVVSVDSNLTANAKGDLSSGTIELFASGSYQGAKTLNLDYYARVLAANPDPTSLAGLRVQLFRGDEAVGPAVDLGAAAGVSVTGVALGTVDGVTFTADLAVGSGSLVAGERSDGLSTTGRIALDGGASAAVNLVSGNNFTVVGGSSFEFLAGGSATINLSGEPFSRASFTISGPEGRLAVDAAVAKDTDKLAAAQVPTDGSAPAAGDGETARAIADLAARPLFEAVDETPSGFMSRIVQEIGSKGRDARVAEEAGKSVLQQLKTQKESAVGVNQDEEMIQLLQFQRGFQAAARFLTTVDELIDTLINRVGLVGR